jgi:hypothetical protein
VAIRGGARFSGSGADRGKNSYDASPNSCSQPIRQRAGVTVLYLGDNLKTINDGDRVQVIGTVGLAFAY